MCRLLRGATGSHGREEPKEESTMTKASPEFFRQYLDALAAVITSRKACTIVGIDDETARKWDIKSRRDQAAKIEGSVFLFEHAGVEAWFHEHTRRAVSRSVEDIEASARDRALNGTYTVAQYRGQTVYKLNPDWIDEGMRELLGLTERDMYLRDANGNLVPEVVWQPPATDLVLGILSAHSNRYKRQSKIDIDMRAQVTGGILVAEAPSPKIFQRPVPAPMLEIVKEAEQIEEAEVTEIDDRVTDTSPTRDDEPEAVAVPTPEPEPERIIREAAPPAYQATASERAGRPLTPLEQDLLGRLRSDPSKRSASPIGSIASTLERTRLPR
jgi:hypothetical protein